MSNVVLGSLPCLGFIGIIILFFLFSAIRVVQEYERGVIFRLGRFVGAKGPGLFLLIPIIDRMVKIDWMCRRKRPFRATT